MQIKIENKDESGIGEILVNGDNITRGYFEDETKTNQKIIDGWMHTGDLGKIDNEGFLYIYGRNNDIIVLSNGKKIFPEELEVKINRIDRVKESFIYEEKNKINAKIVYNQNDFKEMTYDEIYNAIMEDIKKLNDILPQYKKVNEIKITSDKLEKTVTGKIKRNIEHEKLKKERTRKNLHESENETYEKIINILICKLGNKEINEESDLVIDLGADSLDLIEIFLEIEKEFNLRIEKEERRNIKKIKDLLNIIDKN